MKAIQFIKDHGVEKAREVVEGAPEFPVFGYCALTGSYIFKRKDAIAYYHNESNSWSEEYALELILLDDLKRLVESVDLVGKVGGITKAKAQVKQAHEHGYQTMSIPVEIDGSIGMGCLYIDTLEKAIADYEAIYSGAAQ